MCDKHTLALLTSLKQLYDTYPPGFVVFYHRQSPSSIQFVPESEVCDVCNSCMTQQVKARQDR